MESYQHKLTEFLENWFFNLQRGQAAPIASSTLATDDETFGEVVNGFLRERGRKSAWAEIQEDVPPGLGRV